MTVLRKLKQYHSTKVRSNFLSLKNVWVSAGKDERHNRLHEAARPHGWHEQRRPQCGSPRPAYAMSRVPQGGQRPPVPPAPRGQPSHFRLGVEGVWRCLCFAGTGIYCPHEFNLGSWKIAGFVSLGRTSMFLSLSLLPYHTL